MIVDSRMNIHELPMARAFAYRFRVRHDELDSFGHLNNAVCVKYMQEAAIQASADAGYSLQWYEERGVAWVIRRLEIRYYLQVRYGDELEVTTWISECGRSTCVREYDVTRTIDGARVARGRALWVYIDSKSGRPIRLPQEIKIALSPGGEKEDLGIRGYKSTHGGGLLPVLLPAPGAKLRARSPRAGAPHGLFQLDRAGLLQRDTLGRPSAR